MKDHGSSIIGDQQHEIYLVDGRLVQHYSQNVPTRAKNSIMRMQQPNENMLKLCLDNLNFHNTKM